MANAGELLTVVGGDFAIEPEPNRDMVKSIIRRQMNQAGNILLTALEPFSEDEFFAEGLNGISTAWNTRPPCMRDGSLHVLDRRA